MLINLLDVCFNNKCQNGDCRPNLNDPLSYECNCWSGWAGPHCDSSLTTRTQNSKRTTQHNKHEKDDDSI